MKFSVMQATFIIASQIATFGTLFIPYKEVLCAKIGQLATLFVEK